MGEKFDPKCHIGETHGIYTIVDVLDEKDKYGHYIYKSICNICGHEKFSHYGKISGEKSETKQCCHIRIHSDYIMYRHEWTNKRIGRIFRGIISRCYDENNKDYDWYGGKGVKICREWLDDPKLFEEWAMANGYQDNLTIDRIDSNKNYCPENCQWIPLEENSRKAGLVTWIDLNGKNMTGRQWADYLNIGTNIINTAIRKHGLNKAKELILAMLKEPPSTKQRKANQTWFSVYGIQV